MHCQLKMIFESVRKVWTLVEFTWNLRTVYQFDMSQMTNGRCLCLLFEFHQRKGCFCAKSALPLQASCQNGKWHAKLNLPFCLLCSNGASKFISVVMRTGVLAAQWVFSVTVESSCNFGGWHQDIVSNQWTDCLCSFRDVHLTITPSGDQDKELVSDVQPLAYTSSYAKVSGGAQCALSNNNDNWDLSYKIFFSQTTKKLSSTQISLSGNNHNTTN